MDWLSDPHPERNPLLWLACLPYALGGLLLLALAFGLGWLARGWVR